jgi:hypothetical protein
MAEPLPYTDAEARQSHAALYLVTLANQYREAKLSALRAEQRA